MIKWFLFVLAAVLPIIIDGFLYFYVDRNIFGERVLIDYLVFVALILSADTLRFVYVGLARVNFPRVCINMFVIGIVCLCFSVAIHIVLRLEELSLMIPVINEAKLRGTVFVVFSVCFILGLAIQVLEKISKPKGGDDNDR